MVKSYPIAEVFGSIQGEGVNSGVSALFIRFAGCNLKCPFCDTNHSLTSMMTLEQLAQYAQQSDAPLIVLTGGEPGLWIDSQLVAQLKSHGAKVCIETNGTCPLPDNIDFVTLSPKDAFCDGAKLAVSTCDELKIVYTGSNNPADYDFINATHRVLQPCDTGSADENQRLMREVVDYCMSHPQWRVGLQLHKVLSVR